MLVQTCDHSIKPKGHVMVGHFFLAGICLSFASMLNAEEMFDETNSLDLPDFNRVYGIDARPEAPVVIDPKVNAAPVSSKEKIKQRLVNTFTGDAGSGVKYGVQDYTKFTGSKRYGFGVHRKGDRDSKVGVTVHENGVSLDRQRKNLKYYLGMDRRNPIESKPEEDSSYMFFGVKAKW